MILLQQLEKVCQQLAQRVKILEQNCDADRSASEQRSKRGKQTLYRVFVFTIWDEIAMAEFAKV